MRRVLFVIAFILLANPLISNVDILPDFIAYILIMIALAKPSYIDEKAFSAYKSARVMLIVSACKAVSVYFSTIYLDNTISLLFSFTFFVIELIFGIPLLLKLFGYFSNLALASENQRALNVVDVFKIICIVIFALRLLLATLPDFAILTADDTLTSSSVDMTRFRPVFIIFSLLASIPISNLWIMLNTVFLCILFGKREELYIKEEFNSKISNKNQHYELKANYRFLLILVFFVVFSFEIRLDNVNVFINTFLPIAFIVSYLILSKKKYLRFSKLLYALCGITAIQLVFRLLELKNAIEFSKEYNLEAVLKVSQAETLYLEIIPFAAVGMLLFSACVSIILVLLIKGASDSIRKNMILAKSEENLDFTVKSFNKRVRVFAIVTSVFSYLNAITYVLMIYFLPENQLTEAIVFFGNKKINLPIYSMFMPLNMIISALFIISFILTLFVIYDNVYKKMYEKISLN